MLQVKLPLGGPNGQLRSYDLCTDLGSSNLSTLSFLQAAQCWSLSGKEARMTASNAALG